MKGEDQVLKGQVRELKAEDNASTDDLESVKEQMRSLSESIKIKLEEELKMIRSMQGLPTEGSGEQEKQQEELSKVKTELCLNDSEAVSYFSCQ